jgi:hypothetical protein
VSGESSSPSTSTLRRYGSDWPQTSCALAVRPPDAEWNAARIGSPFQVSTSARVSATARATAGFSARTPP